MTCVFCGTSLAEGSAFCAQCGRAQAPSPQVGDAPAPVVVRRGLPSHGPLGRTSVLGVSLVAAVALAATAYGQHDDRGGAQLAEDGYSDDSSTYSPPPDTYSPPPETYSPPPVSVDVSSDLGAATWTAAYSQTGGYTFRAELSIGSVRHAETGLVLGDATSGACDFDSQTDALVPYQVRVTNTTSNFTAKAAAHLTISGASAEATYSDQGATCQQDDFGVQSTQPLSDGASSVLRGFFVVPRYYTPDAPSGDPAVLREAQIRFTATTNDAGALSLDTVTGPGVEQDYGTYSFTLAPAG